MITKSNSSAFNAAHVDALGAPGAAVGLEPLGVPRDIFCCIDPCGGGASAMAVATAVVTPTDTLIIVGADAANVSSDEVRRVHCCAPNTRSPAVRATGQTCGHAALRRGHRWGERIRDGSACTRVSLFNSTSRGAQELERFLHGHLDRVRDVRPLANSRIVLIIERNYGGAVLASRIANACAPYAPVAVMTQDGRGKLRRAGVVTTHQARHCPCTDARAHTRASTSMRRPHTLAFAGQGAVPRRVRAHAAHAHGPLPAAVRERVADDAAGHMHAAARVPLRGQGWRRRERARPEAVPHRQRRAAPPAPCPEVRPRPNAWRGTQGTASRTTSRSSCSCSRSGRPRSLRTGTPAYSSLSLKEHLIVSAP